MAKDIVCPECGETILKADDLPFSPEKRYSIQIDCPHCKKWVTVVVDNDWDMGPQ